MFPLLRLLRPHQWIKNSFVFAGIIFAHQLADPVRFKQVLIIALAFSFLSSAVYIINDLLDRTTDRFHPVKKDRPLASGMVNQTSALMLALILSVLGLCLAFITTTMVVWLLFTYLLLNLAYSSWLKKIAYLDVITIAFGFILRILAGTTGIGIPPSMWILICSFTLTLYLAITKRRVEQQVLISAGLPLPNALQQYQTSALSLLVIITAVTTVLSYFFYAIHQQLQLMDQKFIYTTPLVAFGIFRYFYLSYNRQRGSDVACDLFQDQYLLTTVLLWLIIIIWV